MGKVGKSNVAKREQAAAKKAAEAATATGTAGDLEPAIAAEP